MPEDRRPDRPRNEANSVNQEDIEGRNHRIRLWEEELRKDQAGSRRVKKEVVPLDRRSDRAGNDRSSELRPFVNGGRSYCHVRSPLLFLLPRPPGRTAWETTVAAALVRWAGLHLPSHPLPYLYKDATRRCLLGRGRYENRPELVETGLPVGDGVQEKRQCRTRKVRDAVEHARAHGPTATCSIVAASGWKPRLTR